MDDSTLLCTLSDSYKRQLDWYESLAKLVQKTVSQIVLSRGDVSVIMSNVAEKQKVLQMVMEERNRVSEAVLLWQKRKKSIPDSPALHEFELLLGKTESAIKDFLDHEAQLKCCLDHILKKALPGKTIHD